MRAILSGSSRCMAAIVIGNGKYSGSSALRTPERDAIEMARCLSELGFVVYSYFDQTADEMRSNFEKFVEYLKSKPVQTAIIYYSGHGVQIQGENYLVPIDFDIGSRQQMDTFIPLQEMTDRIAVSSEQRIVLLDACRSAPVVREAAAAATTKGIHFAQNDSAATGLAALRAAADTFIAFAAAPGDYAYVGSGELSTFTAALTRHIFAVDLPIDTIMVRVRNEVLVASGGRQKTWNNSSLRKPFVFNPGSLLLFTGNAMALFGLFCSFIIYTFVIIDKADALRTAFAAGLCVTALLILLAGVQSVYGRLRLAITSAEDAELSMRGRLLKRAQRGAAGAFLGSLIAGPVASITYFMEWRRQFGGGEREVDSPDPFGFLMLELTFSCIFIAVILGITTQIAIGVAGAEFANSSWKTRGRQIGFAVIGGVIAGVIAAPPVTLYFGQLNRPMMLPPLLLPSGVLGSAFVAFAIINFDLERQNPRQIFRALVSAIFAVFFGLVASLFVFMPLYWFGVVNDVVQGLADAFSVGSIVPILFGAAIYGAPVGAVLGLVIGLARLLPEVWERHISRRNILLPLEKERLAHANQ